MQIPTATRDGLVTAGYLGLSPVMTTSLEKTSLASHSPAITQVCAGIASGVVAAFLTQPADTIKTRMQVLSPRPKNIVYNVCNRAWKQLGTCYVLC